MTNYAIDLEEEEALTVVGALSAWVSLSMTPEIRIERETRASKVSRKMLKGRRG